MIYQKASEAGQILSKEVRGCDETVTAMCILKFLNCTRKSVLRCQLHNLERIANATHPHTDFPNRSNTFNEVICE